MKILAYLSTDTSVRYITQLVYQILSNLRCHQLRVWGELLFYIPLRKKRHHQKVAEKIPSSIKAMKTLAGKKKKGQKQPFQMSEN